MRKVQIIVIKQKNKREYSQYIIRHLLFYKDEFKSNLPNILFKMKNQKKIK